jgi:predicted nucleic acid-binding Zn ribbon protein
MAGKEISEDVRKRVIMDYENKKKRKKIVEWALVLAIIAILILGVVILWEVLLKTLEIP